MQDIIDWLCSEMDYSNGVEIFDKYCKNKIFVRNLRKGTPSTYASKLEYEMKKLLGIPMITITSQKCSNQQLINEYLKSNHNPVTGNKVSSEENIQQNNNNVIPDIINRAKEMLKDLNTEIAFLHNQLYDLGESNDSKIVKKRKKLLEKRIPLIDKHERLYQLKEEYFLTRIVPAALELILTDIPIISLENKSKQYDQLSDIELVNMQKRLASNITKWRNKLNYQSDVAQKEKNSMPEGPKRKAAEAKLKDLEKDCKEVIQIINKRK